MKIEPLEKIDLYIESIIFSATEAVNEDQLLKLLSVEMDLPLNAEQIGEAVDRLIKKYESDQYAFGLVNVNNGYLFKSKTDYHSVISEYLKLTSRKKLTKTAMESLAIIAYKQPVTRSEISNIRGVNSDYIVQKLLEKDLIEIAGRSDEIGKPLLYKTSDRFLEYFGLKNTKELPKLKEVIQEEEGSIGEPAPIENGNELSN
ncbi:MAG: SMC-Scp complex subunit ScpB [Saprospirales bacterium]|nr:MAG: SMC-Scp complex subunit ScpB [Saprospirales bacterium]